MIKSLDHALEVQVRRHANRKVGMAKLIRRYLLKNHSQDYKNLRQSIISNAWKRTEVAAE